MDTCKFLPVKMNETVLDAESDDIIIVEGKSNRLPNFKEIDTVVRRIVEEATKKGKTGGNKGGQTQRVLKCKRNLDAVFQFNR